MASAQKPRRITSNDIPRSSSDDSGRLEAGRNQILFERSEIEDKTRAGRFQQLLDSPTTDLVKLQKLAWSGIPRSVRSQTWMILLGYLPTNKERRKTTLERKRSEYISFLPQYERISNIDDSNDASESSLLHQIHIDVLRTHPLCPLFQNKVVQKSLETILFLWALRHPATGYVQGINDLVTPFFIVFLSEFMDEMDIEECCMEKISEEDLRCVEADSFWCMTKLLDSIQENYTFAQPGIQRMIFKLQELIHKIDGDLANHLEKQEIEFIQFAFRWMNCLLMRELPLRLVVRIWDTYLAEAGEFSSFHIYVCAAFLLHWSKEIRKLEFQDLMIFLQKLPTSSWKYKDIDVILSQAYLYKSLYHDAPSHLRDTKS